MSSNTVTNRLAKMVIQLEDQLKYEESEFLALDPEDEFYPEDNVEELDVEFENPVIESVELPKETISTLSEGDYMIFNQYLLIR